MKEASFMENIAKQKLAQIQIRLLRQYCLGAMSESCERLCQFILDLIRCRDWCGSDDECILDRDEICEIMKFLDAD